jgi:hypothetical protein
MSLSFKLTEGGGKAAQPIDLCKKTWRQNVLPLRARLIERPRAGVNARQRAA